MADLDFVETGGDANLAVLFWWRRDTSSESATPASLTQRLLTLAERNASVPDIRELPGNRLRANAAVRRAAAAPASGRPN